VTNTATQIEIIEALGGHVPDFAHHSLLTGPQGESLSKRLGTMALRDLRAAGIEPMAILSLMARLGSADPVELRSSHEELIEGFDIGRFGAAPTKFDADDLAPLSARTLAGLPVEAVAEDLTAAGLAPDDHAAVWSVIHDNVATRADIGPWVALFRDGAEAQVAEEDRAFVEEALGMLGEPPYGPDTWSEWTSAVKGATGRKGKGLFMPLRLAVTGQARGPEMAQVMPLLKVKPKV
jgi:glutamyl-tRNA synthetase